MRSVMRKISGLAGVVTMTKVGSVSVPLYVAMTRAKDQLALIVPHRFYVHGQSRTGDQHLYASRSRFFPASIASEFEVCAWPPVAHGTHSAPSRMAVSVDIAPRMRGRWRTGT